MEINPIKESLEHLKNENCLQQSKFLTCSPHGDLLINLAALKNTLTAYLHYYQDVR